jgi:hypothetical protein
MDSIESRRACEMDSIESRRACEMDSIESRFRLVKVELERLEGGKIEIWLRVSFGVSFGVALPQGDGDAGGLGDERGDGGRW